MRPRNLLPTLLLALPLCAQELDRLAPNDAYSTQATPRPSPPAPTPRPTPALTPGRANLDVDFSPSQAPRPTPTPVDEPGAPATEPQGFTITLKNFGPVALPAGAVAEYRVYFRRHLRDGDRGTLPALDRLDGRQVLGALAPGESFSFQSPVMDVPRATRRGNIYYYSDGTRTPYKAGAYGAWLRVTQGDKLIYERRDPMDVQPDGKW